jgi:hypothetical protein
MWLESMNKSVSAQSGRSPFATSYHDDLAGATLSGRHLRGDQGAEARADLDDPPRREVRDHRRVDLGVRRRVGAAVEVIPTRAERVYERILAQCAKRLPVRPAPALEPLELIVGTQLDALAAHAQRRHEGRRVRAFEVPRQHPVLRVATEVEARCEGGRDRPQDPLGD